MTNPCVIYNADGDVITLYPLGIDPAPGDLLKRDLTDDEYAAWVPGSRIDVATGNILPPAPPTDNELLMNARTVQSYSVRTACAAAIAAGFTSSALGSVHSYQSTATAQGNIQMCVALGGSLWCADGDAWTFTAHTAAQAAQVQADMFAMIQTAQAKYAGLLADIAAATTVEAVNGVTW